MTRHSIFALRVNSEERELIAAVARKLQRSQSDTVRLVMRNVAHEMGIAPGDGEKQLAPGGEQQGVHDARR